MVAKVGVSARGQNIDRVENSVMGRIFGPKREELTGKWRKVSNEELHDKDCLPDTKMMNFVWTRWMGYVA